MVVLVLLTVAVMAAVRSSGQQEVQTRSQFITGTPEADTPVRLDTTTYLPRTTPAPAILLAHGFGGSKAGLDSQARALARAGYVVLTYSARGFGKSGGLIHMDSPDYEVADARRLVSYLATQSTVTKDSAGDPRVGVAGSSYGGALALLLAGTDRRIDAVGADTWNNLSTALFPDAVSGQTSGVFKKLWVSQLFQAADPTGQRPCGRFAADVCAAYQNAGRTGQPNSAMERLMAASSPARYLDRITAPTLLTQGQQDSLFDLSQANANARGIAANGTETKVIWRSGGHDGGTDSAALVQQLRAWFDPILRDRGTTDDSFQVAVTSGNDSTSTGSSRTLTVRGGFGTAGSRQIRVATTPATVLAPAGGSPAAVSSLPGLGTLLSRASALTGSDTALSEIDGQYADFRSAPLDQDVLVGGSSSVRLRITPRDSGDVTVFVALYDVAPDGTSTLPSGLVAPVRLTGLRQGQAKTVTVRLPGIVREFEAGHRLAVRVATTDMAYRLPDTVRSYTVAPADGQVRLTTLAGDTTSAGRPWGWLIVGLVAMALLVLGAVIAGVRRRHADSVDPELAEVPISIQAVTKEYADGYRAVDDVTFRVEAGQIVGLLGPNGAGKTTLLRTLMGLISPTSGQIRVFGERITPGAAVLARAGVFVEGPGLLPHLSGRDNLRLYWASTGRPEQEADFETALEIAGLGASLDRRVGSYSQGMRQRLAIAQAMLGLPELLILDEPANGLDPPQIIEMREMLRQYAATGRTVVLSSHLLDEVEQTCTHVVVMHKGRLITSGSVADIVGTVSGPSHLAVEDPARAVEILTAAGVTAQQVSSRHSLEEVFMELVGDDL